jgi:hypothetical protein
LLWVASLTPTQASAISSNSVVSPDSSSMFYRCCDLRGLIRSWTSM